MPVSEWYSGPPAFSGGERFGQYEIVRLLGRGGMGEAYEVNHRVLRRRYALKVLPEDFGADPDALERFAREARVAANLTHGNIVRVDDFGRTDDRYWMRMELATGLDGEEGVVTLADLARVRGGRIPEAEFAGIVGRILAGLAYPHEHGVVHCDLKPSNILFFGDVVKIADFGLARLVGEEWVLSRAELSISLGLHLSDSLVEAARTAGAGGSSANALMGTYAYMSPEQKHGEEADARSDIYSLGLIVIRLLTGEELGITPPSQVEGLDLDPGWDELVRRCLVTSRDRRCGDCRELLALLPGVDGPGKTAGGALEGKKSIKGGEKSESGNTAAAPVISGSDERGGADEKSAGPRPGSGWTVPELEMEFVYVPAGSFRMGSDDGDPDEKPVHAVRISHGFWLGKYEVTQEEYEKLMGKNPSRFKGVRNPVECVSWNDAVAFCKKLTERERAAGRLPAGYVYRLPTEAEWEYAARGGPKSKGCKYSGSDDLDAVGWYDGNSGRKTHPVGQKQPNELGLYDMSGNVWEWCLDWYDSGYYRKSPGTDPVNTAGASSRVSRGGSWYNSAGYCRAAIRDRVRPDSADSLLGFRVCLAPSSP